jgi:hypothetical protein
VIPVGVMLSIIGGPFFLYLLLARRSERYGWGSRKYPWGKGFKFCI